tara:strand:+ start:1733 stop:2470 length:738 start_codon:yes stop_codon:yes gene_type:complete
MVNSRLDHFKINENLIENLKFYFDGKFPFEGLGLKNLSNNYNWPRKGDFPSIKAISSIDILGKNNYEKNIFLKKNSSKIWSEGSKFEIAKWAISDWGGIRRNKTKTIEKYIYEIENKNYPCYIEGVASYSKILSFMKPDEFAIYDARVAISLNAIQLLSRSESGVIFTYLSGRNKALTLFRNSEPTKTKNLIKNGWQEIEKNKCYSFYLNYLKKVNSYFPTSKLYELEMSLFADAESLADRYLKT